MGFAIDINSLLMKRNKMCTKDTLEFMLTYEMTFSISIFLFAHEEDSCVLFEYHYNYHNISYFEA